MHTIVRINIENIEELIYIVEEKITPSLLQQRGCRQIQIFKSLENPNELNIISEWDTEEDARNYFRLDKIHTLWESLPNAHLVGGIRYLKLVYNSKKNDA
ncbi:antibiotic biosynthesis monooxygenase family protein [Desulfovibrio inopinatus]|uniref:antibiotic biosynthesis monooxygenase family protein n=1 Tax=Desulfovibrio inopinatus TaxID=102109 RepID=UPI000419D0C6|nr:antibiotic biosynthesis monooxygenase family protein [Desulfovibrio inopinatus]